MPRLPPKTSAGHIEAVPPSRILDKPLEDAVIRYMLEHANGNGPPEIVISYNCDDFECPDWLLPILENITIRNKIVYMAPYPSMTAMVAVTAEGEQLVFKEISMEDVSRIENFISSRTVVQPLLFP